METHDPKMVQTLPDEAMNHVLGGYSSKTICFGQTNKKFQTPKNRIYFTYFEPHCLFIIMSQEKLKNIFTTKCHFHT